MPTTVQAVLAARIDRLPPEEKALLQTAAVIGKDVPFALLQAIAGEPEEALRRDLTHLQVAEFLYETSLFPEIEYTFKHALTHEVGYGSLLQERRRALHAKIVEALERLYPDRLIEHLDRLAHHAFRGELWGKGVMYFRQAGAKAVARSAHREAVACFEQALRALTHLPESRDALEQAIDLRFDLRQALIPLGEHGQILDDLREAETLAEALGDHRRLGLISAYMAQYYWLMADPTRAVESGQRAVALAAAIGDFALQVVANLFLGVAYRALGDYREAIERSGRNVASLEGDLMRESFGLPGLPSVLSRTFLVWSLAERGEFSEGIARGEEAVQVAEAVDHPFSLIVACYGLGSVFLVKGDFQKAVSVLERGLQLCHVANIPVLFPEIASSLGSAYALSGRVGEGLPLLEQGVKQAASARVMFDHSLWVAWLSEAYLLAGRMDAAMRLAARALDLSRERKERGHEAWSLRLLAAVASRSDNPDIETAGDHYRQALVLADELGMRPLVAHCHLGLGKLYRRTGERRQAQEHLTTATDMFREMDMRFWLEKAEAELKELG